MSFPYVKTRGSGWFWCHHKTSREWAVYYINSLWGARIDSYYVRTENFDDVVGPLQQPEEDKHDRT